jgi:hypothetical protein
MYCILQAQPGWINPRLIATDAALVSESKLLAHVDFSD